MPKIRIKDERLTQEIVKLNWGKCDGVLSS